MKSMFCMPETASTSKLLSRMPTRGIPKPPPKPLLSPPHPVCSYNERAMLPRLRALLLFGFVLSTPVALAKDRWTELNIGPFYIDTQDDVAAARNDLTQLEQVRWVLGGLLESKDLPSLWPIRILLVKNAKTNPNGF